MWWFVSEELVPPWGWKQKGSGKVPKTLNTVWGQQEPGTGKRRMGKTFPVNENGVKQSTETQKSSPRGSWGSTELVWGKVWRRVVLCRLTQPLPDVSDTCPVLPQTSPSGGLIGSGNVQDLLCLQLHPDIILLSKNSNCTLEVDA